MLGFDPTATPFPHTAVGARHRVGNLLVAPLRVVMGGQDDLGAPHLLLGATVGSDQSTQGALLFGC